MLRIFFRLHSGARSDDTVNVRVTEQEFAGRQLRCMVGSLQLALLVPTTLHDGLADSIIEAEMLVCVWLATGSKNAHEFESAIYDGGLLPFQLGLQSWRIFSEQKQQNVDTISVIAPI